MEEDVLCLDRERESNNNNNKKKKNNNNDNNNNNSNNSNNNSNNNDRVYLSLDHVVPVVSHGSDGGVAVDDPLVF